MWAKHRESEKVRHFQMKKKINKKHLIFRIFFRCFFGGVGGEVLFLFTLFSFFYFLTLLFPLLFIFFLHHWWWIVYFMRVGGVLVALGFCRIRYACTHVCTNSDVCTHVNTQRHTQTHTNSLIHLFQVSLSSVSPSQLHIIFGSSLLGTFFYSWRNTHQ